MPTYTLVTDNGIPSEETVHGKRALKRALLKFKHQAETEDNPYNDIWVYDEKGKDVTTKMFKELKVN